MRLGKRPREVLEGGQLKLPCFLYSLCFLCFLRAVALGIRSSSSACFHIIFSGVIARVGALAVARLLMTSEPAWGSSQPVSQSCDLWLVVNSGRCRSSEQLQIRKQVQGPSPNDQAHLAAKPSNCF